MANCFIRTFNPNADPTYKKTFADWLILLRSDKTHTELQFSARYKNISFSATTADDCKCARFKMINYTKHPLRWETQEIVLTDEQEDLIMAKASKMADYPCTDLFGLFKTEANTVYYGPKAMKYDLLGMLFSFVHPWRIWQPDVRRVFCSEAVCMLIQIAYPDFNKRADEQTPETLFREVEFFRKAARWINTSLLCL